MFKRIKNALKKNEYINIAYRTLSDRDCREHFADLRSNGRIFRFEHLGDENYGKNIYLIREGISGQGLFSLIVWTLRKLEVAEKFHFTPIVYWNECIPYSKKDQFNQFTLYYKQVSNISIESALNSESIAFAYPWDCAFGKPKRGYDFTNEEIERLSKIYKKYMILNPELRSNIEDDIKEMFRATSGKILGVHVRGVDWRNKNVIGHPIPYKEADYLIRAVELLEMLGYENVFLASDSEYAIELFESYFGERLIVSKATRTARGKDVLEIFNTKNDGYRLAYEALLDIYSLAKCDSLLCGLSYLSYTAQIINRVMGRIYTNVYIMNKGIASKGITPDRAKNLSIMKNKRSSIVK